MMLHAALRKKPGSGDLSTEDALTATIFERFSYIPADLAWSIFTMVFRPAMSEQMPIMEAEQFAPVLWPSYCHPDGGRVEPDVVLVAGNATLVIEVKQPGGGETQRLEQWRREIAAVQQSVSGRLILVAMPAPVDFAAISGGIGAEAGSVDWDDLADAIAVALRRAQLSSTIRVLEDMLRALRTRGCTPFLPLSDSTRMELPALRIASRSLAAFHQSQLSWLRAFEYSIQAVNPALSFFDWQPDRHGLPPARNKSPLQNWAWDFLPLLSNRFVWTTGAPGANAIRVGLSITLDGGWPTSAGEPSLGQFDPPEWSQSPVVAWVYRIAESGGCSDWPAVWNRRQAHNHSVPSDGVLHPASLDGLLFALGKVKADLIDLPDHNAWKNRVFAPVCRMIQGHSL